MEKTFISSKISIFRQKRLTTLAGAWVYYFLISLIPLVFLLVEAFSVFNVSLTTDIVSRLPEEFRLAGQTIVDTAENASKSATVFFVLTVIFSCTGLLNQMSKDGDFIYGEVSKTKRGIMRRVWAVVALGALFLLFLGLAFLFAFGNTLDKKNIFYFIKNRDVFLSIIAFSIAISCGYAIICVLNKFISPVKLKFRYIAVGSLLSLFIMVIGTIAFTLYLRFFANYNVFYGSLAGIIIFLLWSYIIMFGLAFGTIINMQIYSKSKEKSLEDVKQTKKERYVKNTQTKKVLSKGSLSS